MTNKKDQEETLQESGNNPFRNDVLNTEDSVENNEQVEEIQNEIEEVEENSKKHKGCQCEALSKKYDELNNQYIRLAADFDNYRKRQVVERENLLKYGAEETMKKLIEVLDNFDRGSKAIEKIDDCQQVKDSYNLVCKQMYEVLAKAGLEVIDAEGQEFDPMFHEAVMQTPTSEYAENTVINQLQKGYKLGDKVLRAALVNVATAE